MGIGSTLRRLGALAAVALAAGLPAQSQVGSFDLDRGREPVVPLDGLWRFQPGDSPRDPATGAPAWAQPAFDDSSWALIRGDGSWSTQGYPAMSGYAWYRFAVTLPDGSKPASMLLAPIVTSFEIYVDGKRVGGSGRVPTGTPATLFSYHLFPLSAGGASGPRTVHVALRVWHSAMWAGYMGGGPFQGGSLAGDPGMLAIEQHHLQLSRNTLFVDIYSYSVATAVIGLVFLYLVFMRPGEREYLWFGIVVLAQSADSALTVLKEIYAVPPIPVFDLCDGTLNALVVAGMFLFFARILRARLLTGRLILLGLLALSPVYAVLYWPGWASVPISAALQLLFMLPAMIWILYLLVQRSISGNKDARLLLLPVFLTQGYWTADNLVILLAQAGWMRRPAWMDEPLPLPPFTMHIQIFLNLVFLLAMMIFLVRRFSLTRRHEERLQGEFEAARQVQQVLLPDELDQCGGFRVECIYRPAEQVGGDFFQQIGDGRGGMSIVVGDVSGKGLPAAMLVSVLVGAIRAESEHGSGPVDLLASLNEGMIGRSRGAFATCLAAHLDAAGRLTLANAGHLPPYLNGQEIGVPGALPLGIVSGLRYESVGVQLASGDRLTFVSDGVVEAQSKSGELFGFDRTRALSAGTAIQIAEAAQAFGQSDDITVVTVEFSGVPAELARA